MTTQQNAPRKRMLSLQLKDKNALYAAFMPFLENGGLFIPTYEEYKLGDDVFLLLTLMDEPEKIPVAGSIVWVTPRGAAGNRTPGIGVQFNGQDGGKLRNKIENIMAGSLHREKPTHTI